MSIFDRFRRTEPPAISSEEPAAIIRRNEVEALRSDISAPDMDQDGNDPMASAVYARVVKHADGYGYEICVGGVPAIVQRFHPDKEGDAPMTEDEARSVAAKALSAYGVV